MSATVNITLNQRRHLSKIWRRRRVAFGHNNMVEFIKQKHDFMPYD